MGLLVAEAAWPEVERQAGDGAIGILPVGAAAKEHGPHLPMNTDWRQAEWLAARLVQHANVLVWPTLGYGHYPAFTEYPGSITLSAATFANMAGEILAGIRRSGVTRCLILNTGMSTIRPLEAAMAGAHGFADLRNVNVYTGPRFRAVEASLREQPRGGHADEIETSLMLAIAPQAVDMSRAQPAVGLMIRGRFDRRDPDSPNYSPTGVYGDPTLASMEKGRRLLEAMLADVLAILGAMGAAPGAG